MSFPKISIITPSYNQGNYLEQTILTVLNQNYPNLEYIIIDGGSTDNSVKIIKKYESKLAYWVSEPDKGLYDALSKGFNKSTGDIMGWLNSDDMLHNNSLFSVAEILMVDKVEWVMGHPTIFDELGRTVTVASFCKWSKYRYYEKDFKFIQQESTYWTRDLWNKAGAHISVDYKYAGDMELWNRFFKIEKLYTLSCLIGGFRLRSKDQLSLETLDDYNKEAEEVLNKNHLTNLELKDLKQIGKLKKVLKNLQSIKILNIGFIIGRLNQKINALYDFPKIIDFDRIRQKYFLR